MRARAEEHGQGRGRWRGSEYVSGELLRVGVLVSTANPHAHFHSLPTHILSRLQDSLHFANASALKDRLQRVEMFGSMHAHPGTDDVGPAIWTIIIDCRRVLSIDARCVSRRNPCRCGDALQPTKPRG